MTPAQSPYDNLAEFYDLFLSKLYTNTAAQAIHALLEPCTPNGGDVLDVCCGVGHLADELTRTGYRVGACDQSSAMVARVPGNAPASRSWVADVRDLSINAEFDAVVCTYNSLNHMLTRDDLSSAFKSVRKALRPGGVFVFDLLDKEGIRINSTTNTFIDEQKIWATRVTLDEIKGFVHAELTVVWPKADSATCWQRADTTLELQWHPSDVVLAALSAAGFGVTERIMAAELGLSEMYQGRAFYRALNTSGH